MYEKEERKNDFEWEVSESFSKDITFKIWGQVSRRQSVGRSGSG